MDQTGSSKKLVTTIICKNFVKVCVSRINQKVDLNGYINGNIMT